MVSARAWFEGAVCVLRVAPQAPLCTIYHSHLPLRLTHCMYCCRRHEVWHPNPTLPLCPTARSGRAQHRLPGCHVHRQCNRVQQRRAADCGAWLGAHLRAAGWEGRHLSAFLAACWLGRLAQPAAMLGDCLQALWHTCVIPSSLLAAPSTLMAAPSTLMAAARAQAQSAGIDAQSTATLVFQLRMETDQATNSSCTGEAGPRSAAARSAFNQPAGQGGCTCAAACFLSMLSMLIRAAVRGRPSSRCYCLACAPRSTCQPCSTNRPSQ